MSALTSTPPPNSRLNEIFADLNARDTESITTGIAKLAEMALAEGSLPEFLAHSVELRWLEYIHTMPENTAAIDALAKDNMILKLSFLYAAINADHSHLLEGALRWVGHIGGVSAERYAKLQGFAKCNEKMSVILASALTEPPHNYAADFVTFYGENEQRPACSSPLETALQIANTIEELAEEATPGDCSSKLAERISRRTVQSLLDIPACEPFAAPLGRIEQALRESPVMRGAFVIAAAEHQYLEALQKIVALTTELGPISEADYLTAREKLPKDTSSYELQEAFNEALPPLCSWIYFY